MKRLRLSLFLLVVATVACDNIKDPVSVDFTPALQGVVTDAVTDQPLARVRVEVDGRSAVTAANGRYFIADLRTGSATVSVTHSGYAPYSAAVQLADTYNERNIALQR